MGKAIGYGVLFGLAGLWACGGGHQAEGSHDDRPSWVDRGGAAFKDKAVYGVGIAEKVSSVSLRRSAADTQARAELARVFSTRMQNLIKLYNASTIEGDQEAAEAHRQEATKAFTEMQLTGAQIVDRFWDKDSNIQYSLARLDAAAFEGQLDQMARLSAKAKAIIRANADRAFEEIDEASDQRKQE